MMTGIVVSLAAAFVVAVTAFNLRRATMRERVVLYVTIALCLLAAVPLPSSLSTALTYAAMVSLVLALGVALWNIRRSLKSGENPRR